MSGIPSVKRRIGLLSAVVAMVIGSNATLRANTEYDVVSGQSDLTSAGTYTVGGAAASSPPTTTSDVTFDNGVAYSPTDFTMNSSLSIGTLDDLDSSDSLTISNTGSAADVLTLNGGTNSVAPTASDLLYVASGGTLTINGGSGSTALGLSLASAGNLDIAGTATISSIITGTKGLALTGGGTLTLSGANTFTGGVTITSGTLKVGATTGLGAAANTVTVANGGTLDLNGINLTAHTGVITLNGAGPGGTGAALINSGASLTNPNGVGPITLGSASTFSSGPNRLDIQGALNAAGFAFTKIGTGYTAMKGATSNLSVLNVNQGSWEVSNATGLGVNVASTIDTVAPGATIDFFQAPAAPYLTTIDLNGGLLFINGTVGTVNLNGSIVLGASSTINGSSGPIAIGGIISGTGDLTTAGKVTLSGANTFAGNTTVNGGTTTLSNTSGSATSTGNITVATNATLLLNGGTASGNVTLGSGSILSTSTAGTIGGSVTGPGSGTAATLQPGGVFANSRTFGTLNLGSLAATQQTTLNFDLSTPTASDLINVTATDGFTATSGVPLTFGAVPASAGTFNLVAFNIDSSGAAPDPSNFAASVALNPRLTFTLQETPGTASNGITPYDLQLIVTGGAPTTTTFTGTTGTSGSPNDWNDPTQWLNGVVGGLQGDTINFNNGDSSAGSVYVNLNGQQHVGTLNFNNTGTDAFWIEAGSNASVTPALYLDNGSSTATVTNSANYNTIAAPVVLFSNATLSATSGATLEISGPISGAGLLTIPSTNAGTIVLSGTNTNAGGITLAGGGGGLLAINSAGALGTGLFTLASGATFDNTSSGAVTVNTNPPQSWGGNFTFIGSQNLSLGTGAVALTASTTITVNGNTLTVGGGISGASFGITKAGNGTLLLTTGNNGNSYTGPTIVNAGILELTGSGGSAGVLAGTPSITVNSGAELLIAGSNNDTLGFSGGHEALIINDGTVLNNGSGRRVTLQNVLTMTGGTLGGTSAGDGTNGANGAFSFDDGGTAVTATSDAAGNPATINVARIGIQTNSTLNVTRGTSANLTAAMPDLMVSTALVKFGANENLTKTGNGIAVFGGANTYTGTTTVSAGTLRVNGSSTGTGAITVAAAGTLGGSGSVAGATTVNGTITAGPDALTSGLFTTAAETWPASGNYLFKLASDPSGSSAGNPGAGGTSSTWDEITFTTLNVSASSGSPFTVTLNYTVQGFDNTTGFTIPIAYSANANAINGGTPYSPAAVTLASLGNTLPAGTSASNFSVVENADNAEVDLVYTPAPEPSSLALLGLTSAAFLKRRRRAATR